MLKLQMSGSNTVSWVILFTVKNNEMINLFTIYCQKGGAYGFILLEFDFANTENNRSLLGMTYDDFGQQFYFDFLWFSFKWSI